jgi:hypothetical protein
VCTVSMHESLRTQQHPPPPPPPPPQQQQRQQEQQPQHPPPPQGFTVEGLNRLEDALLGALALLDSSATSSGGLALLLLPSPAATTEGATATTTTTTTTTATATATARALLVAEHLGAPKALREVTAAVHAGEIRFAEAAARVLACLDDDAEVMAAVERLVGHGEALVGRLEAVKGSPART